MKKFASLLFVMVAALVFGLTTVSAKTEQELRDHIVKTPVVINGKNVSLKTAYAKSMDVLIISLIIFAVFAFNSMAVISSMGLLLFWGWLVVLIGNLLLTVPMLKMGGKK